MWVLEHGKDRRGFYCHVYGSNPYYESTNYPSGYLTGELPPHYPVPSVLGPVSFDGYAGCIYIDQPHGDDWVICWDSWDGELVIWHGDSQ